MWFKKQKTKKGVNYYALNPSLMLAGQIAENVYQNQGFSFIITSTDEGVHKKGSLHYHGLAFDCRTRHLTKDALRVIVETLKERLNTVDKRYQVILSKDHIHIEFDRRLN